MALNKSAVDFGASFSMSLASIFVTAKLASIFLIPAPPGVPLTTITSVFSAVACFVSSCAKAVWVNAKEIAVASIPFVNNVFMVCAPENNFWALLTECVKQVKKLSLASGMSNKIDPFANDCKGKIQSIAK